MTKIMESPIVASSRKKRQNPSICSLNPTCVFFLGRRPICFQLASFWVSSARRVGLLVVAALLLVVVVVCEVVDREKSGCLKEEIRARDEPGACVW